MKRNYVEIANLLKCAGLGIFFLCLFGIYLCNLAHACESEQHRSEELDSIKGFFPPDLVPHPHIPDPPKPEGPVPGYPDMV